VAAPGLVRKLPGIDGDGIVKLREKHSGERRKEHGGALVGDHPLSIHHELVAARFTAEDGVIFEYEAGSARTVLAHHSYQNSHAEVDSSVNRDVASSTL
jgi:hypothetical protein